MKMRLLIKQIKVEKDVDNINLLETGDMETYQEAIKITKHKRKYYCLYLKFLNNKQVVQVI